MWILAKCTLFSHSSYNFSVSQGVYRLFKLSINLHNSLDIFYRQVTVVMCGVGQI